MLASRVFTPPPFEKATVTSSSLRVSLEVTTMPSPRRGWRTRVAVAELPLAWNAGRAAGAGGTAAQTRRPPDEAGRRPVRRKVAGGAAAPTRHSQAARARPRVVGLAARAEIAAGTERLPCPGSAGLAAPGAPRAASRADRRTKSAAQTPSEDQIRIHLATSSSKSSARSSRGPAISTAGISNRKRLGTERPPWPQVARRAACDRNRRRLARVMPT